MTFGLLFVSTHLYLQNAHESKQPKTSSSYGKYKFKNLTNNRSVLRFFFKRFTNHIGFYTNFVSFCIDIYWDTFDIGSENANIFYYLSTLTSKSCSEML